MFTHTLHTHTHTSNLRKRESRISKIISLKYMLRQMKEQMQTVSIDFL